MLFMADEPTAEGVVNKLICNQSARNSELTQWEGGGFWTHLNAQRELVGMGPGENCWLLFVSVGSMRGVQTRWGPVHMFFISCSWNDEQMNVYSVFNYLVYLDIIKPWAGWIILLHYPNNIK